jgi:hypothetical protein
MTSSSAGDEAAIKDAWRELVALEGEGLEAYGRALKEFGQGTLDSATFVRDVLDLTAHGTADAARISLRLAEDYYRWAWSLFGVRVNPSGGWITQSMAQAPETAPSSEPTGSGKAEPH